MDPFMTSHYSHQMLRQELETCDRMDRTTIAILRSRIGDRGAQALREDTST